MYNHYIYVTGTSYSDDEVNQMIVEFSQHSSTGRIDFPTFALTMDKLMKQSNEPWGHVYDMIAGSKTAPMKAERLARFCYVVNTTCLKQ